MLLTVNWCLNDTLSLHIGGKYVKFGVLKKPVAHMK